MKTLKLAALCLAVGALTPLAQANTAVCTANAESDCKKVRVFVTADGAGCKAEVEFEKILLRYPSKKPGVSDDHKIQYKIDDNPSDKAKYFFDEKEGIEVLKDPAKRVKSKHRDPNNKKNFDVTVSHDQSPEYVVAYIANVMREEKSPKPPTLCTAVDPTIENR